LTLLEAGKLKLAAKARLAEGGDDARYEAAVLYHAAARAEQRALLAREAPSPETRLASAIERCACLIEGFDAMVVLESAWTDVLVASSAVAETTATAMRVRIDMKMTAFLAKYDRTLRKIPGLKVWMESGGPIGWTLSTARELDIMLEAFPGDARLWGLRSWAHVSAGEIDEAWNAIRRARSLMPEDTSFEQVELHLVPMRLPPAQAEHQLAGVKVEIERGDANADICFGFVGAAVKLATQSPHRERLLQWALEAAIEGFRMKPLWVDDRKFFRAAELILRELLAGRKPTIEILYRCGLGRLAATAAKKADPLAIVLSRTTPFRRLDAAA
jgi:hypothetical protein